MHLNKAYSLSLLALEPANEMEVSDGVRLATTEKHEPFQQCCNTVSFWFKNTYTHSQMLSVHTTKFCRRLFQELLGKVSLLQILEVALTPPPCFRMTRFTFCFITGSVPFLQRCGVVSHKCYLTVVFKQNHLHHCA